ncbi:phosphotransferase [Kribbella qitaiheensis]|uniref:Phosphotransferase n=1 Tax=Kribbella qitaiheensis TaxID=1544730 RepID=A0A7G6WSW1_9ACTN|nr:phosphotransferase [Kribbella qitaiheensis]QNE17076.1 phosphotransferase [Kribbella qitaiheensis]
MTITDNGWDSRAWLEGDWLHRAPRRPEVGPRLLAETRLLPWLAPQLPLPIPIPEPTEDGVRHRLLVGEPIEEASTALGRELGSFLRALHAVDPLEAVAHGALDPVTAAAERVEILAEMRAQVLPLLSGADRVRGAELLDNIGGHTTLVHGDFGPDHVRVHDGRITGIIDWTDAHIGDPGLDLCWLLHATPPALSEAAAETYQPEPELVRRAYDWYRLGPWYEVVHGLGTEQPEFVESGLSGVLARL